MNFMIKPCDPSDPVVVPIAEPDADDILVSLDTLESQELIPLVPESILIVPEAAPLCQTFGELSSVLVSVDVALEGHSAELLQEDVSTLYRRSTRTQRRSKSVAFEDESRLRRWWRIKLIRLRRHRTYQIFCKVLQIARHVFL